MTSKQLNYLLGAIAVIALAALAYMAWGKNAQDQTLSNQNAIENTNTVANNGSANNTNSTNSNKNTNQSTDATANWKTYSNNSVGVSLRYPTSFQIAYKPAQDHRILISDHAISFPEIGGNNAPIAIGKIQTQQDLTTMLDNMQDKKETKITVDGQSARRIEGYLEPYPGQRTFVVVVVVVESKNLMATGSELKRANGAAFDFDLLPVFDQIVSTIDFTK